MLLDVGGVLAAEAAAVRVFDRLVLPNTVHVQLAASAVAGAFVWAASRVADVGTAPALALVVGAGAVIHYGLFALDSEQFRTGSVRTVRELGDAFRRQRPA